MALIQPLQDLQPHDHSKPEAIYGFDARGVAKRFRHAAIFGALDALQPGEARTVSVAVPAQRFAVWDANVNAWRIAAGSYGLSVAASSRDPQALSQTVTLAGH